MARKIRTGPGECSVYIGRGSAVITLVVLIVNALR